MSDEKIPVPKDEVNGNFLCCFPTRSWSGKRINGYQVVEKSFDEKEPMRQLSVLLMPRLDLLLIILMTWICFHLRKVTSYTCRH